MRIFRFFYDIFNVFTKAKELRQDESARAKSVRFALSAIIYSVIAFALVLAGSFLFRIENAGILYIFLVVIAVVLLFGAVILFIGALLRVIAQFSLNRRVASWLALTVFLIAVVGAVISVIYILK